MDFSKMSLEDIKEKLPDLSDEEYKKLKRLLIVKEVSQVTMGICLILLVIATILTGIYTLF